MINYTIDSHAVICCVKIEVHMKFWHAAVAVLVSLAAIYFSPVGGTTALLLSERAAYPLGIIVFGLWIRADTAARGAPSNAWCASALAWPFTVPLYAFVKGGLGGAGRAAAAFGLFILSIFAVGHRVSLSEAAAKRLLTAAAAPGADLAALQAEAERQAAGNKREWWAQFNRAFIAEKRNDGPTLEAVIKDLLALKLHKDPVGLWQFDAVSLIVTAAECHKTMNQFRRSWGAKEQKAVEDLLAAGKCYDEVAEPLQALPPPSKFPENSLERKAREALQATADFYELNRSTIALLQESAALLRADKNLDAAWRLYLGATGTDEDARPRLEKIVSMTDRLPEAYVELARIRLVAEDFKGAMDAASTALVNQHLKQRAKLPFSWSQSDLQSRAHAFRGLAVFSTWKALPRRHRSAPESRNALRLVKQDLGKSLGFDPLNKWALLLRDQLRLIK